MAGREKTRLQKTLLAAGLDPNDPQTWAMLGLKISAPKTTRATCEDTKPVLQKKYTPPPIAVTPADDALARDYWGNFNENNSPFYERVKEAGFPYGGDRDPDHWDEYCFYEW